MSAKSAQSLPYWGSQRDNPPKIEQSDHKKNITLGSKNRVKRSKKKVPDTFMASGRTMREVKKIRSILNRGR